MRDSVDIPFAPRRLPFFYGWVIVVVSTLGAVLSIPGQTVGMSVFTEHLIRVLGLERIQLSAAYMYGTIGSGLVLPFAGRILDRVGARRMVVVASLCFALTLVYLSCCDLISELARRVARLVSVGVADSDVPAFGVITFGFFLVRFWGQGVLTIVSKAMLGKWFQARRGLVMGISGVLTSMSFACAPTVLASLVAAWHWNGAWGLLALVIGVGMTSVGWLCFRDNPEECGLLMDGAERSNPAPGAANSAAEHEFTLGEALRTYSFWVVNAAFALPALVFTAITFHIIDLGARAGLTETATLALFPYSALFSIVANFVCGWLSDRVRVKYLICAMLGMQIIGSVGLLQLDSFAGRVLFVVGFGVTGGILGLLAGVIWPRFYGRRNLGAISSVHTSLAVFASALGPWIFATSARASGDYSVATAVTIGLCVVCIVAALAVENPQSTR